MASAARFTGSRVRCRFTTLHRRAHRTPSAARCSRCSRGEAFGPGPGVDSSAHKGRIHINAVITIVINNNSSSSSPSSTNTTATTAAATTNTAKTRPTRPLFFPDLHTRTHTHTHTHRHTHCTGERRQPLTEGYLVRRGAGPGYPSQQLLLVHHFSNYAWARIMRGEGASG